MTKKKTPITVTFIIDVSGSMDPISDQTTKGVRNLAKEHSNARFNLVEFGHIEGEGVEVVFKNKKGKKLENYKHEARGWTPMWDGIGAGLSLIDATAKNLIIIMTDGEENGSKKWDNTHVKPLLKALTAAGTEFLFTGVDVNSSEISASTGIGVSRISSYNFSADGGSANFAMADTVIKDFSEGISGSDLDTTIAKSIAEDDLLSTDVESEVVTKKE